MTVCINCGNITSRVPEAELQELRRGLAGMNQPPDKERLQATLRLLDTLLIGFGVLVAVGLIGEEFGLPHFGAAGPSFLSNSFQRGCPTLPAFFAGGWASGRVAPSKNPNNSSPRSTYSRAGRVVFDTIWRAAFYSDSHATEKLVPSEVSDEGTASSAPVLPLTMMISCTSLPKALIAPEVELSVASLVPLTSV